MRQRLLARREWKTADMVDKCYFCKGKLSKVFTTIDYRWGDRLFVIEDVPATICQQCGEKYLDSQVYKELERMARCEEPPLTRVTVDVFEYKQGESLSCGT